MKVVEQLCIGKKGKPELCEDALFVNDHFAAVVDGCTNRIKLDGVTPSAGVVARQCIISALEDLDPRASKEEAFSAMNSAIHRWYVKHNHLGKAEADAAYRPTAYAAVVSAYHRQVWVLGDCQALVNGNLVTRHKAIDTLMEDLRAMMIEHALLQGETMESLLADPQPIQSRLEELMRLQSAFQNASSHYGFSYTALDGFFSDFSAIQTLDLPSGPIEVVLASDGYPSLYPTLQETESALYAILQGDPLLTFRFRATKPLVPGNLSFDDRSYLRIIV